MNYEIVTFPGILNQPDTEHVVITREDGSLESFPVDETNARYVQFLEEIA